VVVVTRCLDMKCYVDAMHLEALDYLESPQASVEIAPGRITPPYPSKGRVE